MKIYKIYLASLKMKLNLRDFLRFGGGKVSLKKPNLRSLLNIRRLTSDPKRLLTTLMLVGVVLFFNTCASVETLRGSVQRVVDGDTIVLVDKNGEHRIRLHGIDAPESNTHQPFGEEAKVFLRDKIEGKSVKIIVKEKRDKYGRIVGVVKFDGDDINEMMVSQGLAWAYTYYTDAYAAQQSKAKGAKLGLWADENATNPYEWRKMHKNKDFK